MERIYARTGVPVRRYPLRGQCQKSYKGDHAPIIHHLTLADINEPAPAPVTTALEEDIELLTLKRGKRRMESKLHQQLDNSIPSLCCCKDVDVRVVRNVSPPLLTPQIALKMVLSLNCSVKPGITSTDFKNLFARCRGCDLVMTRHIFEHHECIMREADVTDLTIHV
jgi:hypothetical protein